MRSQTRAPSSRRSTSAGTARSPMPGWRTGASISLPSSATSFRASASGWIRELSPHGCRPGDGAVDFKRLEFVRTRAWKRLATVLERFDALLCPTMSQVARPVDEDDFIWYEDHGDGRYHGLDMTAQFNFTSQCPALNVPPAGARTDCRSGFRSSPAATRTTWRSGSGRHWSSLVPGPTDARRSRLAALAIVTANGVDLWVEQEGEGDDVLFISGLADEGACWVDQVSAARGPLPGHDLRQPRRRPLVHAGRPVPDHGLCGRHGRAHGRARDRACACGRLLDGRGDRAGARARASRTGSQPCPQRNLVPRRPLPARGVPKLDVVGREGRLDRGLSRGREPLVLSPGSGTRASWTNGSRPRRPARTTVRRCVLPFGRRADRPRLGRPGGRSPRRRS